MSSTANTLKQARQKKNRAELSLARERDRIRRADTRRKIELGGLIIKAKMDDVSKSVLLGILIEAKQKLAEEDSEQWKKSLEIYAQNAW